MKFNRSILFSFTLSFLCVLCAFVVSPAQSPTVLKQKCPNTSVYAQVQITGVGDINVNPCSGRTTTFTQNVVLPSGTVIAGGTFKANNGSAGAPSYSFVNSPTTGFYRPATDTIGVSTAGVLNTSFSGTTNLFVSPIQTFTSATSDNHNTAIFSVNNAAANAEFKISFIPGVAGAGSLALGDSTGAAGTNMSLNNVTQTANVQALISGYGDVGVLGNGTALNIVDSTKTFTPTATGSTGIWDASGIIQQKLDRTITAGGTTGAQTINKQAGTVNFAAAATSLVVTNSTVTANSIITGVMRTADTTCTFIKSIVPTSNSFTITVNAGCNAETSVGFIVWN